ncbi:hypothetical protein [Pseudomonas asplenii]|uniref:Uncharacterized protein n=1 Tax=Pseudomonas asplenii TaxID=53407 RepID=A0A1H6NWY7_9PSED|nr:hypothetical protein [Pseudomonas fuscovaginae]SEI21440.1 hypothetical protein SAMN05216581_4502 [Pseudomonas fuscovaginae]
MAYFSGSANNISDLRTLLIQACVAGGYTLSGEVLRKGKINIRLRDSAGKLEVTGGTGIDTGNNLTGGCPAPVYLGAHPALGMSWPASYEVFILNNPDELYLVVNYSVDRYQWAAWGVSNVPSVPGTGLWFGASGNQFGATSDQSYIQLTDYRYWASWVYGQPAIFWRDSTFNVQNGASENYIHVGLDGQEWAAGPNSQNPIATAGPAAAQNLSRLPNTWNNEGVLLPIQAWLPRPSGKISLVADLAHARYTRIDFLEPKQVITLGQERWRIYPFIRKNTSSRDGMGTGNNNPSQVHSGTYGWALRYDGA